MSLLPNQTDIQIMEGESVKINCTVHQKVDFIAPYWKRQRLGFNVTQEHVSNTTVTLVIDKARPSDAGLYNCVFKSKGQLVSKILNLTIKINAYCK